MTQATLTAKLENGTLDDLTKHLTGQRNFGELATNPDYIPTFRVTDKKHGAGFEELANAYDKIQSVMGTGRKAIRN